MPVNQKYQHIKFAYSNSLKILTAQCLASKDIIRPFNRAYKRLIDIISSNGPISLFKYSSCASNWFYPRLKNIEDGVLHLSRPDSFNDPYDVVPQLNIEKIRQRMQRTITQENLRETLLTQYQYNKPNSIMSLEQANELLFPQFASLKQRMIDDTIKRLQEEYNHYRRSVRIASLCESALQQTMWAYYADSGAGFVTEYLINPKKLRCYCRNKPQDSICSDPILLTLSPIQYEGRFDWSDFSFVLGHYDWFLPYTGEASYLALINAVTYKDPQWSHEQEWRIACLSCSHGDSALYVQLEPTALYLGWKTSKEDSNKLKDLASRKGIPIFQVSAGEATSETELYSKEVL